MFSLGNWCSELFLASRPLFLGNEPGLKGLTGTLGNDKIGSGIFFVMEDDLLALINLIYEASFDSTLWPTALISLADTTGTAQVSVAAMDRRAQTYDWISPRTDPVMRESYKNYWAFHNPFRLLTEQVPAGEVFSLERIMSRKEFSATPVFNEWFRPAEFGLAILAVNLGVRSQVSTLLCVTNAPKNDHITGKQTACLQGRAAAHRPRHSWLSIP